MLSKEQIQNAQTKISTSTLDLLSLTVSEDEQKKITEELLEIVDKLYVCLLEQKKEILISSFAIEREEKIKLPLPDSLDKTIEEQKQKINKIFLDSALIIKKANEIIHQYELFPSCEAFVTNKVVLACDKRKNPSYIDVVNSTIADYIAHLQKIDGKIDVHNLRIHIPFTCIPHERLEKLSDNIVICTYSFMPALTEACQSEKNNICH